MFETANSRPTGVMIPKDQMSVGTGEPGAVVRFCKAECFAVTYGDTAGKLQTEIFFRIGGKWHQAPNGANFAASLKAFRPGSIMAGSLESAYEKELENSEGVTAKAVANIPSDDAVDPMGGE